METLSETGFAERVQLPCFSSLPSFVYFLFFHAEGQVSKSAFYGCLNPSFFVKGHVELSSVSF